MDNYQLAEEIKNEFNNLIRAYDSVNVYHDSREFFEKAVNSIYLENKPISKNKLKIIIENYIECFNRTIKSQERLEVIKKFFALYKKYSQSDHEDEISLDKIDNFILDQTEILKKRVDYFMVTFRASLEECLE